MHYDIEFNSKKSVIMIAKTREDQKLHWPSFVLGDQELNVGQKVRYLGHIIRNDLSDDDDVQRQCCKLYAQANMLARKFHIRTEYVKTALFRAYCTPLYTAHLWCSYSKGKMKKIQVAFNDAFRILLKLPRWTSTSQMFVTRNVPTFHAVLRKFIYQFKCRLSVSENLVIKALADPLSDTRYLSLFPEAMEQWFRSFLTTIDFLAAMIGHVSSYCIVLYFKYCCCICVLWTHGSGIKKYIYLSMYRSLSQRVPCRVVSWLFDGSSTLYIVELLTQLMFLNHI